MRTPLCVPYTHVATSLCLALILGACAGGDVSLPPDGEPAAIAVIEGDEQSGRVGEPLAEPLVVQVTDSRGRPVGGATVVFEFGSAGPGASVVPEEKTTNGDGLADARLVLGTTVGRQTGGVRVVTDGAGPPVQASFSAIALSESANSMAAAGGQDQSGHVGQPLADQLVVEVTDGFGNPVAGVPITWTAEGGGSVSEAVVETGEDGRSRVDRILGPAVGQQATLAHSDGLAGSPVIFVHTAVAGDASLLTVVSGNDQTAAVGSLLPQGLVARLVDSQGNGVPNTAVTWVVATGGGTVSPENSTTDNDGYTSAQWTLGGALGGQRVDAVVSGVGVASFRATATAAAPASLFISTQPSASARNGVRLDRQPVIQLRDAQGNDVAVAGVQVAVSLGGGGELRGTIRRTTDASGRVAFGDLAISGAPGRRTLVFSAAGYAQVTSSEIELQAIGTTTTITGDSPDPSAVGSGFTVAFRVTSQGPTPTGSVTVSDGNQSCSGSLVNGAGSCQLALTTPGERTLTVTYPGVPGLIGSSDTEAHTVVAPPPSNEAPDADYSWDCEALVCQFTDESEDDDGTIQGWSWDFGGTGTSIEQNPSHTFPGAGSYTVTLTVTDDDGSSDARSIEVRVEAPPPPNQSPTAAFTWECDELECDFEDESTDDGRIESRAWNFGDGNGSDERNPDHEYTSSGTYQVTLAVTDNDGAQSSVTHEVSVTAAPPPPANTVTSITGDNPDPSEAGTAITVTYTVTSSSGAPEGSVRVTEENGASCTGTVASGGCALTPVGIGTRIITAVYEGGPTFNSSSNTEEHTVTPPAPATTTTTITSDTPEPSDPGQEVLVSFTVTSDAGTPTGTVTVSDGGDSCTGDLAGGAGSCSLALSTSGPRTLTASYEGGPSFAASSDTEPHTVNEPATGVLGLRTQPPSRTESGERLQPEPEVVLLDEDGNSVEIEGVTVNAAVASGAGTLQGPMARTTDREGRAKFKELRLNGEEGAIITLAFTAAGFAQVDSQPILIEDD